MILNTEQVMMILPHRDPFLFIDSVDSVTIPGRTLAPGEFVELKDIVESEVVARYRTKKEHAIFKGHFPDYPILPGVVQVEMMAQATSFVVFLVHKEPMKMKMDVALLSITEAKFRKPVLPEMDLKLVTKVTKVRGSIITSECKLYHDEQLMSEATVMASLKML
ncbi:MAG: 3-hydroxyacyl-ACP dehydratase FabZ family protein [Bacteriovorax sp.]|jgi:3-hydroxyacyl-[acyl-carrier-protein] dehydratase